MKQHGWILVLLACGMFGAGCSGSQDAELAKAEAKVALAKAETERVSAEASKAQVAKLTEELEAVRAKVAATPPDMPNPHIEVIEWVLRNGGSVEVTMYGVKGLVQSTAELRSKQFTIVAINLDGQQAVNDASLESIVRVTTLERLWLPGTSVTDRGLEKLAGLGKLSELNINYDEITDEGLRHLGRLTELEWLHLSQLRGSGVTDAGIMQLKANKKLRLLGILGAHITDDGLEHLKELKNLTQVWVGGTKVTDTGVASFKAALPQCVIHR